MIDMSHSPFPTRLPNRPAPSAAPLAHLAGALLLGGLCLLLAGCGHGHHDDEGDIVVDNRTIETTNEILFDFMIARFGQPFSADLLGGDLDPGSARHLGTFDEDYYDAEGNLEGGQIIEWFDVFIGDDDTTVFEVR